MPSIVIEGLADLQADLAAAGRGLDEDLEAAIDDATRIVADQAARNAPKRSGRMAGSIRPERDGLVGEVTVSARKVSPAWPGGFPYPPRIERSRPFLAPAVQETASRVVDALEKVLDDLARRLGGS